MKNNDRATSKAALLRSVEKTYPISFLSDEHDREPTEAALTQEQLFELLSNHEIVSDKATTAFIPGTFIVSGSREEADIRQISLIVYDVDCKSTYYRLYDLQQKLSSYTSIVYSTFNASYEHPRWRVILLLEHAVSPEDFDEVYRGLAKKLDLEFDLTCTNINRLFYLPTASKHSDLVESWTNTGLLINPNEFITKKTRSRKTVKARKSGTSSSKKNKLTTALNRGYVSFSSLDSETQFEPKPVQIVSELCGFPVPAPLQAPFSQEEFDELLKFPGTWLQAARYMGFPIEHISAEKPYSKSFSSVIPGVEDNNPSCSIALYTENGKPRVVYQAFNETHFVNGASGPVKFDLSHIYAMMHCGRRIEKSEFPAGSNKVWLTRLLIAAGMIIPEVVEDLPELPESASGAERLYVGFRELLQCKRAFKSQSGDATAFSLTFACYWCKIGNRSTAKKYTQILLEAGVIRFVDRINLPRGGSIPLVMPAGKSASVYQIRRREERKSQPQATKATQQQRIHEQPAEIKQLIYKNIESVERITSTVYQNEVPGTTNSVSKHEHNAIEKRASQRLTGSSMSSCSSTTLSKLPGSDPVTRMVNVVRERSNEPIKMEMLLAEAKVPVDDELIALIPLVKRYISDYDQGLEKLLRYRQFSVGT